MGLTSDKYDKPTLYDEASSVMAQKLSQISGVGQVSVGGGSGPSVRVEVNPTLLYSHGLTIQNVQSMLTQENVHEPLGQLSDGNTTADIVTNDQMNHAADYKQLIIGYNKGAAVRLSDVADVSQGQSNIRNAGYLNGVPSITVHDLSPAGREYHRNRRPRPRTIAGDSSVDSARHQDHNCR